jgi:hypothetical protein
MWMADTEVAAAREIDSPAAGGDARRGAGDFDPGSLAMSGIIAEHYLEQVVGVETIAWKCAARECDWRLGRSGDSRRAHGRHVEQVIREAFTIRSREQLPRLPQGVHLVEVRGTVLVKGVDSRYHDTDEFGLDVQGWRERCVELPVLCVPWRWAVAGEEPRVVALGTEI